MRSYAFVATRALAFSRQDFFTCSALLRLSALVASALLSIATFLLAALISRFERRTKRASGDEKIGDGADSGVASWAEELLINSFGAELVDAQPLAILFSNLIQRREPRRPQTLLLDVSIA